MCRRTSERYIGLFIEDDLAQQIMLDVTDELVKRLELDVSKQRLDSTHIESNMAKFGRIKLMATAIRRFLVQVKRHDEGSYKKLRRNIRDEYRIRSGIEGTNSCLKRVPGLDRLRVRGRPAVFTSTLLKVAGWNILQAARLRRLMVQLGSAHE